MSLDHLCKEGLANREDIEIPFHIIFSFSTILIFLYGVQFPIATHPKGPYKHHLVVRVDTGADVNCMNKKTFKELFPEVKLSVCPHKIQNF